ncbi:porin [Paraburkholderia nemoris]|uniref:porin n=1 Tax=Paraburkholderia nemoris TaxID=2793076 RepID=UPI0038BD5ABB
MNRLILPVLVASAFGVVAEQACAQSSVTLYGIIDTAIAFNSNAKGGSQWFMNSGNAGGNRWGLTGTEDLGGGLSAIFKLENGFSSTTGALGQGGTFFGRNAYVGLAAPVGSITMGRQSSSQYDFTYRFSAGGYAIAAGSGFATHPGDVDNLDNFNRTINSVKYQSVSYGGLKFGGSYAFGNVAGDFTRNQVWDLGLSYDHGPVALGLGFERANQPNFSVYGNKTNDSATATNITSVVSGGYATAKAQQIFVAGASYTIGHAVVRAVYSNTQFKDLGSTAVTGLSALQNKFRGTATFNSYELNTSYDVTPALQLNASYAYTENSNASGVGSAHYNQVNLGADYHLSKRTDVYVFAMHERAAGTDATGHAAVAALTFATASAGSLQTIVMTGIRHQF